MIGFVLAAAAVAAPIDPGPAPSWDQAVALGNQAILGQLIDPESARIAWPYTLFGGSLKGLFSKRQSGWITCGLVNARNRMGGYTGAAPFLIVIRNGQVISLDIGTADEIDTASVTCPGLIKKGLIHASGAPAEPQPVMAMSAAPVQTIEQASVAGAEAASRQGGLGVSFLPSGAGLVLLAVAPGSAAARAGLKPGQVIQSANGIDLRGMPQAAAIAVLKGLPPALDFEMAGGTKISIKR